MEEKLTQRLFYTSLIALLLTASLICQIFHATFQEQVRDDLRAVTETVANSMTLISDPSELGEIAPEGVRLTLIDTDGTVEYDNAAEHVTENHLDRPEVAAALQTGSGTAVRKSDTTGIRTCYYALRLPDGRVLRAARAASALDAAFGRALMWVVYLILALLLVCILLARRMTALIAREIARRAAEEANSAPSLRREGTANRPVRPKHRALPPYLHLTK